MLSCLLAALAFTVPAHVLPAFFPRRFPVDRPLAGDALPLRAVLSHVGIGVLGRELMSVDAVRLRGVDGAPGPSTTQVLSDRHVVQMGGVHTGLVPAQVVHSHNAGVYPTVRDREWDVSDQARIREAVGEDEPTANFVASMSDVVFTRRPLPARRAVVESGGTDAKLRAESWRENVGVVLAHGDIPTVASAHLMGKGV